MNNKHRAIRCLVAALAMSGALTLAPGSYAWAAKSLPTKSSKTAGKVTKKSKGATRRTPASGPAYICEEPEITDGTTAAVLARVLSEKCDPARPHSITMTNPGSTYPLTLCCAAR